MKGTFVERERDRDRERKRDKRKTKGGEAPGPKKSGAAAQGATQGAVPVSARGLFDRTGVICGIWGCLWDLWDCFMGLGSFVGF